MKHIAILLLALLSISLQALNPSRTYKQRPEKYNMQYDKYTIKSGDGQLHYWFFPNNTKTTKTVVISHNGEGNMADYLRRIDNFKSLGYNVVIYDYRGYGESSELEIDNSMYILPHMYVDLQAVVKHVQSKKGATDLLLYGWGPGAAISLGVGCQARGVTHIVADGSFSGWTTMREQMPAGMGIPQSGFAANDEPEYSLSNIGNKNLAKIKLMRGSADPVCLAIDNRILQSAAKKLVDKDLHTFDNPQQKDNFRLDKAAYIKLIREFLE